MVRPALLRLPHGSAISLQCVCKAAQVRPCARKRHIPRRSVPGYAGSPRGARVTQMPDTRQSQVARAPRASAAVELAAPSRQLLGLPLPKFTARLSPPSRSFRAISRLLSYACTALPPTFHLNHEQSSYDEEHHSKLWNSASGCTSRRSPATASSRCCYWNAPATARQHRQPACCSASTSAATAPSAPTADPGFHSSIIH